MWLEFVLNLVLIYKQKSFSYSEKGENQGDGNSFWTNTIIPLFFGMYQQIMTVCSPSSWGSECKRWVFQSLGVCANYMQRMRGTWCVQRFSSEAGSESQSSVCMSSVSFTQLNKVSIQGILENIFWYFFASLGVLRDNSEHCLEWHFPEPINKWRQTSHFLFFTLW